jgi:multidrug resistance protein, MATE family
LHDAVPILRLLIVILVLFSVGGVYFNALASTGAALMGLWLQLVCAVLYLIYIYCILTFTNGGLPMAWTAEIFYWVIMMGTTIWYLRSNKWQSFKM